MKTIGYVEGRNYQLLENSTSYYTLDGSVGFTNGTPQVDAPFGRYT